jgi:hypothetical protein
MCSSYVQNNFFKEETMKGRKCLLLGILLVLMLALTGCGESDSDNGGGSATVTGTLTLPLAADGKDYWVAVDNDMDGGNGVLYSTTGTCGATIYQDYSISDVSSGTYYVYAVVYAASSSIGPPADGDYVGFYGGFPFSANATVPGSGTATFDMTMVPCIGGSCD